jgi:hypothetical protein
MNGLVAQSDIRTTTLDIAEEFAENGDEKAREFLERHT